MKQLFALAFASLFLCQCNSVRVAGGAPNPPITRLAIVKNNDIHMSGMQPEIVKQVQAMGITTELVDAAPSGDVYYMTYVANWYWDVAMYLRYFKAELHRGPATVGSVEYNTKGADLNKFGRTANKIRPLLRQLLRGEKPAKKESAPAQGVNRA